MSDEELMEFAALAGLDALDAAELADIETELSRATPEVRAAYAAELRATRELMATVSAADATPPPARLRNVVLAAATGDAADRAAQQRPSGATADSGPARLPASVTPLRDRRHRTLGYLAVAAAVAVLAGVVGWLLGAGSDRKEPAQPIAEQVFSAKDVASRSAAVATGRATVTYSDSADAAVLVMNDVPPPQPGTVYQMWLEGADGSMRPVGTMSPADVAPSTTAVIPGVRDATNLAFTVEPPGGSNQPTGAVVARVPLN
ncbi:anti-sigma factor [Gordonia sp. (in: high G+C Gram-positive bacteria)]|uniref:anti-sigma factor n=1 Tax=Gordonia sp. (in: high G+C Gram-positive bacteria) TaxID=84139 RepID=UPI00263A2814|nr:anti-sigma factor [Gordonia sp. (in: high G+C Gram-positive bacteria)]